MTARELPFEEWHRLEASELATVWQLMRPDQTKILVVEDDGGQIIGSWALLSVLHVEGLWIAPAYRHTGNVARLLLRTMRRWVEQEGSQAVMTASMSPDVSDYLVRIGATEVPGQAYVWPVKES